MTKYIHFTDEEKERARNTDLVSFLLGRGECLKRSGREYLWAGRHITIRGNEWFDQYERIGGAAVDLVMKEYALDYPQAVELLLGGSYGITPSAPANHGAGEPKEPFALPKKNGNMRRAYAYLIQTRGIDAGIVSHFAQKSLIYEDEKYHNAVFVGTDEDGTPRHAHKKSTLAKQDSYRGNQAGSEAEYSFHCIGRGEKIYAFEAPIDMLSHITLCPDSWECNSYVSLCSVSDKALIHQLCEHPHITKISLCLDRDEAGLAAAERIKTKLIGQGYFDTDILSPYMKDWNEDLLLTKTYGNNIMTMATEGSKWEMSGC